MVDWRMVRLAKLVAASLVPCVLGCGGGGGGGAGPTPPGNLLYQETKTLDAGGGTIVAAQQSVTLTVPPAALSSRTSVGLAIYGDAPVVVPNTALEPIGNTIALTVDPSVFTSGSEVIVDVPYPPDTTSPPDDFALSIVGGEYAAVEATVDTQAHTFTAHIPARILASLGATASRSRGGPSTFRLQAKGEEAGQWQGYVEIRKYIGKIPAAFADDWVLGDDLPPDDRVWAGKRIALVIHGINNNITKLAPLAYYLSNLKRVDGSPVYDAVWGANYHFQAPITDNGTLVAQFIQAQMANSSTKLDIYGHSMGGLVARWAIEKAGAGPYVGRLFTLGTPHNGVPANGLEQIILGADNGLRGPGIHDLTGGGSVTQRSTFLQDLENSPGSPTTDYYAFAGNDWWDYSYGVATHRLYMGTDNNEDGIVPVSSAKPAALTSKCRHLIEPSETYYLTHDTICGDYKLDGTFNLDTDPGSMDKGTNRIDRPEWRSPPHPRFRDYVYPDGSISVGVN